MNYGRIITMLEDQLRSFKEQNARLSIQNGQQAEQLSRQSELISRMSCQIDSLTETVRSLEQALLCKESSQEKAPAVKRTLGKPAHNKSEKITSAPPSCVSAQNGKKQAPSPKERGNNNTRRKEHFELEVQEHDIYPSLPGFPLELARLLKTVDSIRYEYIPPRYIKHVNHLHYYLYQGSIVCGQLPAAPLLNSSYDASFIAGMLQLRYIYSMPVERIVKFFTESGFEMSKSNAHGLIKKAAQLFDMLEETLKEAILKDEYLHMDETYYTVLEKGPKSTTGKSSCKGYIWAALANRTKLVHFFYQNGSRARKVLTDYIRPHYRGAIQCDGFSDYKILETDEYPHVIRLACFQHCKRKFLEIATNKDAQRIIEIINRLYHKEHEIPPEYTPDQILQYRKEYAPPILKELKEKLLAIQAKKTTLPKSKLGKAVNYTLTEYPALCNYILKPEYEPDNNAMERINRYISLSRKNSLFCGTHQGAKRAALIYSLACSCRLNDINSFEYFKDILNKFVLVNPNTDKQFLRGLLPDKWKK